MLVPAVRRPKRRGRLRVEQRLQGWTYGDPNDVAKKRMPCPLPFDKLPKKTQDYDRQAVRAVPRMLASLGYEIYRMVEPPEPVTA